MRWFVELSVLAIEIWLFAQKQDGNCITEFLSFLTHSLLFFHILWLSPRNTALGKPGLDIFQDIFLSDRGWWLVGGRQVGKGGRLVGGHVELARHVGVLHEAVVQPRPRAHGHAAHQLGVVWPRPRPCHQPAVLPGPVHCRALRHDPRSPQFAVTHRRVRVESAGVLGPGLRLELVQVWACREAGEAAETGPGGLLIEMDPSGIRRGGDILDNDNTMITRNTGIASTHQGNNPIISSLSGSRGDHGNVYWTFVLRYNPIFTSSSPFPSESSALSISSLCLRSPMMELSPILKTEQC